MHFVSRKKYFIPVRIELERHIRLKWKISGHGTSGYWASVHLASEHMTSGQGILSNESNLTSHYLNDRLGSHWLDHSNPNPWGPLLDLEGSVLEYSLRWLDIDPNVWTLMVRIQGAVHRQSLDTSSNPSFRQVFPESKILHFLSTFRLSLFGLKYVM